MNLEVTPMGASEYYEIRVEGHLGLSWSRWFEDMAIRHEASGDTVLCGSLRDQAALHGVLNKIRDLGLPVVQVNRLRERENPCEDGT
jgi:hypothetical protein